MQALLSRLTYYTTDPITQDYIRARLLFFLVHTYHTLADLHGRTRWARNLGEKVQFSEATLFASRMVNQHFQNFFE